MANVSKINGFRPIKHVTGAPYNGQSNIYAVASGDSTALFVGDVVKLAADGDANGIQNVTAHAAGTAGTGQPALGVVVGVINPKLDPVTGKMSAGSIALDTPQYVPASTFALILVADSPDLIFETQSTAAYALADIGLNADVGVLANAASKVSGNSPMFVQSTSPTASATRPVHVVGWSTRIDNEGAAANNKILVQITTHAQGNAIVGV